MERQPRIRYGKNHLFNNLWTSSGDNYCVRAGTNAQILLENNAFVGVKTPQRVQQHGRPGHVLHHRHEQPRHRRVGRPATGGGGTPFTTPSYTVHARRRIGRSGRGSGGRRTAIAAPLLFGALGPARALRAFCQSIYRSRMMARGRSGSDDRDRDRRGGLRGIVDELDDAARRRNVRRALLRAVRALLHRRRRHAGRESCTATIGNTARFGRCASPALGETCLAEVKAKFDGFGFCNFSLSATPSCDRVLGQSAPPTGSLPPGGDCTADHFACAASARGDGSIARSTRPRLTSCCVARKRLPGGGAGDGPCVGTVPADGGLIGSGNRFVASGYACAVADGVYCDSTANACAPLRQPGEPCSDADVAGCVVELLRRQRLYRAQPPSATRVRTSRACVDGAYCDSTGVCAKKKGPAAAWHACRTNARSASARTGSVHRPGTRRRWDFSATARTDSSRGEAVAAAELIPVNPRRASGSRPPRL